MDPENPNWEFSFNSTPMFVVANTPVHRARRSRYFEYFAVTFQPRFVFDGLEGNSKTGMNARKIIRGRLAKYDSVSMSPLLGNFGEEGNKEWHQYFLGEENDIPDPSDMCPVHNFAEKINP